MRHPRHLPLRLCLTALLPLLGACAGGPATTPASAPAPTAGTAQPGTAQPGAGQPGGELVPAVVGLPPDAPAAADHRLSPGDVLQIEVFRVPELSTSERIDPAGRIVLPLIGPVAVGGLPVDEAESRIEAALGRDYLQDPQVDIFVEEFANMSFTVGGSVKRPGVFDLNGDTTLLEAIAQAQGTTDQANRQQVLLFRSGAGSDVVQAYVIDLKQIMRGELRDPRIASNDRIIVPRSGAAVLLGNVTGTLRGFVSPFAF